MSLPERPLSEDEQRILEGIERHNSPSRLRRFWRVLVAVYRWFHRYTRLPLFRTAGRSRRARIGLSLVNALIEAANDLMSFVLDGLIIGVFITLLGLIVFSGPAWLSTMWVQ